MKLMSDPGRAEIQRAVDLMWLLTRKYRAAQTPFMTACTAGAKLMVKRVIEDFGYAVDESDAGLTWRPKTQQETKDARP